MLLNSCRPKRSINFDRRPYVLYIYQNDRLFMLFHLAVSELFMRVLHWGAVVRQHEHQTRMMITEQMFIPRCNNRFQNRTVEYLMPKLLNNLPLELKSLASPNDVKKHVKDYYLTTQ